VDAQTRVAEATLERWAANGAAATLRIGLETPAGSVEASLDLHVCPVPPRPAWIAVDGLRWDRRVTAGYGFVFESPEGMVEVTDPTQVLLQRFAQLVREGPSDEVRAEFDTVRQRWRLYGEILRALPPLPGGSCGR